MITGLDCPLGTEPLKEKRTKINPTNIKSMETANGSSVLAYEASKIGLCLVFITKVTKRDLIGAIVLVFSFTRPLYYKSTEILHF